MKKMMFFALLAMVGLSFAPQMPTGPVWSTFQQACCQGMVAQGLTNAIYNNLYYISYGQTCDFPPIPYDPETLYLEVCDQQDGLYFYYINVAMTCAGQEQSAACKNAYNQFYSKAAEARGMFSSSKTAYLSAARQALYANQYYLCNTVGPGTVSYDLAFSSSMYRQCMQNPIVCASYCNQKN